MLSASKKWSLSMSKFKTQKKTTTVIIVMKSEKYSICSTTVWARLVRTSTGSVINSSTNGTILSIS